MFSVRFGERIDTDAVIRFTQSQDSSGESHLKQVLRYYCKKSGLVSMRDGRSPTTFDIAYQVKLREPESHRALVADLHQVPGIANVNLMMTNEHEEI